MTIDDVNFRVYQMRRRREIMNTCMIAAVYGRDCGEENMPRFGRLRCLKHGGGSGGKIEESSGRQK